MKHRTDFKHLRVYQLAEQLGDEVWKVVLNWSAFEKQTLGKQLVRAADSIAANLAEGAGRGSYADNRRMVFIAPGSLYETKHWLRRTHRRGLLDKNQTDQLSRLLDELSPGLNAYLRSIGRGDSPAVREEDTVYEAHLASEDQPPMTNDQ